MHIDEPRQAAILALFGFAPISSFHWERLALRNHTLSEVQSGRFV